MFKSSMPEDVCINDIKNSKDSSIDDLLILISYRLPTAMILSKSEYLFGSGFAVP